MRRRVAIPLSGRRFFLWFGLGFLAIGLVLVYAGIENAGRERSYEERGQSVEAIVVEKSIKRASRAGNSSTRYEIAYRFGGADGRAVEGLGAVGVEEWERLAPGEPFRITYLPGAPETSRAAGSSDAASPYILMAMGSLFVLVGGTLFGWSAVHMPRGR